MTLKGAKRRRYMKKYMRERRAKTANAPNSMLKQDAQGNPVIEVNAPTANEVAVAVNPAANRQTITLTAPLEPGPPILKDVKPQVRGLSKHDQAYGWDHRRKTQ